MPRTARASIGGICYHVINRGNGRARVFHSNSDFRDFIGLMRRSSTRTPMRVLSYCLMPNHFHFVVWPYNDSDISQWMHWLLTTHVRRYHQLRGTSGRIWQGRFKAFPIEQDIYLLTVMRYVERNPVRANLVESAEDWDWSSLSRRNAALARQVQSDGPVARPSDWISLVNTPQTGAEVEALRHCTIKSAPYGSENWVRETAAKLGLQSSLRGPGRQKRGHS